MLSKQVVGVYLDKAFGDTLKINADRSYEYLEKLNSGLLGWTNGKWRIRNRQVQFKCDHKAQVAYRLKLRQDSAINTFQIALLLNDSQTPVNIEEVSIFRNNAIINGENFKRSTNIVRILARNYDSIVVKTLNFFDIIFLNTLNTDHGYIARIYPVERLYELDKVPFKINDSALVSTKTKEQNDIFHLFNKIIK